MKTIWEDIGKSKICHSKWIIWRYRCISSENTTVLLADFPHGHKQISLIDVSRGNDYNSFMLSSAVRKIDKSWQDVIAVPSDPAVCVRKMAKDIHASEAVKALNVHDVPCFHVTVAYALSSHTVSDVQKVITKFSAVSRRANKLLSEYYALCVEWYGIGWCQALSSSGALIPIPKWEFPLMFRNHCQLLGLPHRGYGSACLIEQWGKGRCRFS